MNYGQQVLSRLMNPGLVLIVIGAVAVYGSGWIVQRIAPAKHEKGDIICKAIGCLLAIAGALLIFA